MWRLTYDPSPSGDGSMGNAVWVRSLEELLMPNGEDPLLVWMMKEAEQRGGHFALERLP